MKKLLVLSGVVAVVAVAIVQFFRILDDHDANVVTALPPRS